MTKTYMFDLLDGLGPREVRGIEILEHIVAKLKELQRWTKEDEQWLRDHPDDLVTKERVAMMNDFLKPLLERPPSKHNADLGEWEFNERALEGLRAIAENLHEIAKSNVKLEQLQQRHRRTQEEMEQAKQAMDQLIREQEMTQGEIGSATYTVDLGDGLVKVIDFDVIYESDGRIKLVAPDEIKSLPYKGGPNQRLSAEMHIEDDRMIISGINLEDIYVGFEELKERWRRELFEVKRDGDEHD